ncbi:MAG: sensor domain-containing diguanylate cyclase [Sulfuricurvum sp.]|nr:sensor domain-containing diguanylate cyclase [Sulfuricurvum sp.]
MTILIAPLLVGMMGVAFYSVKRYLSKKNDHYHALFNASPAALIELDEQWRIVAWNKKAQRLFGWEASEAIGQNILKLIVPLRDRAHVRSSLLAARKEGKSDSKNFNISKDRKERFCEWHNSRIDGTHSGIICTAKDITEITSHVTILTHQACHDSLTGATNRSVMDDRLHHAIDRAERSHTRIALFFIDLNDFKLVNDQYGHEAGDKILLGVATALRGCLRNCDTISRFGGDEFVIIIEDIEDEQHIQTVRTAIEFAISEPIKIDETNSLTARASIGMALYPDDAADADSLIKAADVSMYLKKKEKPKKPRAKSAAKRKDPLPLELSLYPDTRSL